MNLQKLFNHMSSEHSLILLESEMFEIVNVVKKIIDDTEDGSICSCSRQDGTSINSDGLEYCIDCGLFTE